MTHQSSTENDLTSDQNDHQQDHEQTSERPITPRHHDQMGRRDTAAGPGAQRAAGERVPAAGGRTVTVHDEPVRVHTEQVELTALGRDDWFIGPSGDLYEVAQPAAEHPSGWVEVTDLSMSDDAEQAAQRRGVAEPGTSPRDGFFSYATLVTIDRVVGLAPATEQGAASEQRAAVLRWLTARWTRHGSDIDTEVRRATASVDRLRAASTRRAAENGCVRDATADARQTDDGRER